MSDLSAGPAVHELFRELISARLDGGLAEQDQKALADHSAGCPRCRQVEHDYAEQRRLLRALPPQIPPRDMWARTSAALDRELLREARHGDRPRPSPRAGRGGLAEYARPGSLPSFVLVSASSLVLAVALLVTQLGAAIRLPIEQGAGPTPFGPGVAVAFVGADAGGLTLYSTHVNQGCAGDTTCADGAAAVEARISLPATFEPSTLALAPDRDRLAITGSDGNSASVFAIMNVPPFDGSDDAPSRPRPPVLLPTPTQPGSSVVQASYSPPPSLAADVKLATILDGVYGVGSAAAWSADGQALAFSAMPSDRSRGPDIYVWRVGDSRARPITDDHRSYFASWSGSAVVISRTSPLTGLTVNATPAFGTYAINIATREQRKVGGPQLWLPQVDAQRRWAAGWAGQLTALGTQVVPTQGALYLVDWAAVDPFAGAAPATTPDGGNIPRDGTFVGVTAPPDPLNVPLNPTVTPAAPSGITPPVNDGFEPVPVASAGPGASQQPRLIPVDPRRNPFVDPVLDWHLMWSADGKLLGQWIRDEAVGLWGQLSVMAVADDGRLDAATPILAATAARRGFNLEAGRVAWVAPSASAPSGELRVRVWGGAEGVRDVRVNTSQAVGVLAAF